MLEYINIKGAKVNNLKSIDVKIPRDKLTVITGLSGSRKIVSCVRHNLCRRAKKIC